MSSSTKMPKNMSDRLSTMKFMQRASAATRTEPPTKRQRLSHGSRNESSNLNTSAESFAVKPVSKTSEQKPLIASERSATNRAETEWYLSFRSPQKLPGNAPLQIVSAGYSALDTGFREENLSSGEEDIRPVTAGRKSFGKFNKVVEKRQNTEHSSSMSDSESEANTEEDDYEPGDGTVGTSRQAIMDSDVARHRQSQAGDQLRAERKARKQASLSELHQMADTRRKKDVNLNKIKSISAGGTAARACHNCQEIGHKARDCPQAQRRSGIRKSY